MDPKTQNPENCTHDCHSCGSSCDSEHPVPNVFDEIATLTDHMDENLDENAIETLAKEIFAE